MNFPLQDIPSRTPQPRTNGLTVISDKGLSLYQAENLMTAASPYIDRVKLAFGSAAVTPMLKEKIDLYHAFGMDVYFGGLLFEAFLVRNQMDEYVATMKRYNISIIEISDGAIDISHPEKCALIHRFSRSMRVISEVGSKDKDRVMVTPPYKWIQHMQAELDAGCEHIVTEAKETGNEGLYRDSGEVREGLVEEILTAIPQEKIIWEAPDKDHQLFFIRLLGQNANLANISPADVIPLESMRLGLRGDSFDFFLNEKHLRE